MAGRSLELQAGLRAALRGLRIAPRRGGARSGIGQHRGRERGAGLEFAQYRAYEPGDEPRAIDWKLYARSDRLFVREAERESPLTVWLLLDASASMGQADEDRPDWTRLDAARQLALAIAELAIAQGDRIGLLALGGGRVDGVPAAAGARQRDRLRLALAGLRARGGWPAPERLAPVWERIAPGDLAVLVGDLFDPGAAALAARLSAARREVLAIQVLTVGERDFPYRDGRRFEDPETGQWLPGDAAALRAGFLERFGAAQAQLAAGLDAAGVRHARHVLDEPLAAPLQVLFAASGNGR
ncbi:DUF58 domain-containing protein [Luteimonas huabeiensis]|uniref:DUF58 domain-containing protein n=1 Tax=Luteimonas huabeiensis TaxID=1244513 RepID=UPI000467D21B|nr:DUF58 domain-containing protein [Luteimonas huabeiensis]